MLPNQLAQNKGFDGLEDLREETETSWRISHQYDVEAGTATGEVYATEDEGVVAQI